MGVSNCFVPLFTEKTRSYFSLTCFNGLAFVMKIYISTISKKKREQKEKKRKEQNRKEKK